MTNMKDLFFKAIVEGDAVLAQELLDVEPSLAISSSGHEQAIHMAARYDRTECLALLIRAGSNVNAPDGDGKTPLHLASGHHVQTVNLLLQHRPDINPVDHEGNTPLLIALTEQTDDGIAVARLLRDSGATYGLAEAACVADLDTVRVLLSENRTGDLQLPTVDRIFTVLICVGNCGTTEDRIAILRLLFAYGLRPSSALVADLLRQPIPVELHAVLQSEMRCSGVN